MPAEPTPSTLSAPLVKDGGPKGHWSLDVKFPGTLAHPGSELDCIAATHADPLPSLGLILYTPYTLHRHSLRNRIHER